MQQPFSLAPEVVEELGCRDFVVAAGAEEGSLAADDVHGGLTEVRGRAPLVATKR